MMALADFHFLRPWWLLALLLLPLLGWTWRRQGRSAGAWGEFVDAHLLPHLIEQAPAHRHNAAAWLAAAAWMIACLALAGPAWEREPMPLFRNDAARILAIELSPTMLAGDVKPTRLERARFKINDILEASRDRETALIGYAGDAFVAAPLTSDVNTVRNLVDAMDPGIMPVVGNAPERAIAEAQRLLEQAGFKRGELILLADSSSAKAEAAARRAFSAGLRVSVLGVGSAKGAPVPLPQGGFLRDANGNIVLPRLAQVELEQLASAGGGRYATLGNDHHDIDLLLGGIELGKAQTSDSTRQAVSERFRDRGPWLVLLLLPLALLAFRRGWLMSVALLALASPPQAQAFELRDLWLRADQQAAQALAAGDAARAQALARDPALRGSAAYRAEDFSAAESAWRQTRGADAHYNLGNALAKSGKYEDAIAAYEQALATDPGMEDAKANKQAVEDWLKRKQEESKKQSQDQQGDKGQQEKQQSGGSDGASDASQQDQQSGSKGGNQDTSRQQDSDQQSSQQKPGEQSAEGGTQDQNAQANEDAGQPSQAADEDSGKDASTDQSKAPASNDTSAQQQKQQQAQQQALSQAIDQALEDKPSDGQALAAPSPEEQAQNEQRQALNQWLQRVPDDPGGLLRRKFQLEYERRQRGEGQ